MCGSSSERTAPDSPCPETYSQYPATEPNESRVRSVNGSGSGLDLADESIEKHRKLRFFQEFFGYYRAVEVFKDKGGWEHEAQYLIRDADLLVDTRNRYKGVTSSKIVRL